MKHNTHIYLAMKAIQLMRQAVSNLYVSSTKLIAGSEKSKERRAAGERQHIFCYYQGVIEEATWIPDDLLRDNDPNHIFKLFTDQEFPHHQFTDRPSFSDKGVVYYKFSGGLPYRVDHVARSIVSMDKLRGFNDQFNMKQIMYHYLLLSHYVVDAHVPMHCDLRDDPPSQGRHTNPSRRIGTKKPEGKYLLSKTHAEVEDLWDQAVTPVAVGEGIITRTLDKERVSATTLSEAVTFTLADAKKGREIGMRTIPPNGLMKFMIDICIKSKIRCQLLFPLEDPHTLNEREFPTVTRDIFVDCIGNLMSIWKFIWDQYRR